MEYKELGKTGVQIPVIGQGTMGIGGDFTEDLTKDGFFVNLLKVGIEYGMTFIDTAENYGAGHAEVIVGRAVRRNRKNVFIATKVSPEHLAYKSVIESAEDSLQRLQTDYIDLYQIHWPNPCVPFEETFGAMQKLVKDGKIRFIGVSNFSLKQLRAANEVFLKPGIVSIQIEYNLLDRTIEEDILPYCEQKKITVIAYSPLDQGRILSDDNEVTVMQEISSRYNKTIAQVVLKWLSSSASVITIPKSTNLAHIKENASSADLKLTKEDIELISKTFNRRCINIPTAHIKADQNGLDKFVPKPENLAKEIQKGESIKPIRVVKANDPSGKYEYDLVEGKLRYWAWVIAHNGKVPIRSLIR